MSGRLSGEDLVWDAQQVVHLVGDIVVPEEAQLTISEGTLVMLDASTTSNVPDAATARSSCNARVT